MWGAAMIASVEVCNGGSGVRLGSMGGDDNSRDEQRQANHQRRERQRREREARIDELMEHAQRAKQGTADRAYWSLVYDLELAPMTSNRRQLAELGIEVPPPASLTDAALSVRLQSVIDGLADLYTYLINSDHLSDRALYERLTGSVLDEPVHEICEGSGGREFIDMAGGGAAEDRQLWLSHYATDEEREGARARGEQVPERKPRPFERDRTLPRPE